MPTDLVTLLITARDRERDVRVGRQREVKVTLDELHAIRTRPAAVKRTGFGALLLHAWAAVLGEVEDDVKAIEARIQVWFGGVNLLNGSFLRPFDQRIPSDTADLVLRRKVTSLEWMGNLLGRNDPPLVLDDAHANMLANALRLAKDPRSRAQVDRLRLENLQSQDNLVRALSPNLLRRLIGNRSGLNSRLPQ